MTDFSKCTIFDLFLLSSIYIFFLYTFRKIVKMYHYKIYTKNIIDICIIFYYKKY